MVVPSVIALGTARFDDRPHGYKVKCFEGQGLAAVLGL